MNVDSQDRHVSKIAAAIGESARARMLYCLSDGRARTSTELAAVAEVSASTASAHLKRLSREQLVEVLVEGKHHYYRLKGPEVASVLEALSVLAGGSRQSFVPSTPDSLRAARTCYDHMAGSLGVSLHNCFEAQRWFSHPRAKDQTYTLTTAGERGFRGLGIDLEAVRSVRRRFAFACVDWSERRPHLGGALGAAVLELALNHKWVVRDAESRVLTLTARGRREMLARFGLRP